MADPELHEIRARRLAQLQSEFKPGGNAGNEKSAEDRKREQEEFKNSILSQVLTQAARARLNTLMWGKPDKGQLVENMLLQMARTGQIMGKLGENELISLLEKVSEQMPQKKTTVKFDRRRAALDDSDDDL